MAYVTTITTRCLWPHCSQTATHRVHAQWGDPLGDYCKRHADLTQQQQQERESHDHHASA